MNTLDYFQGEEKDVMLFVASRKGGLDNAILKRTLFYAITRAKQCAIVCGNAEWDQVGNSNRGLARTKREYAYIQDIGD